MVKQQIICSTLVVLMSIACQSCSANVSVQDEHECSPENGNQLTSCMGIVEAKIAIINLLPGILYEINHNMTTTSQIILINGKGSTIQCMQENVGLIFHNKTQVTIQNVTISSCGTAQISSSTDSNDNTNLLFQVSVYITRSSNVTLSHVNITNSTGYGLAVINCKVSIKISNSEFENNHCGSRELPGGGGVYMEQMEASTPLSEFEITRCNFRNNNASTGKYKLENYPAYQESSTYFLFGRGGGLSMNLKTNSVIITVQESLFENNVAHRGGGLFLFFLDGSYGNLVSITNCNFTSNQCTVQKIPESIYSAGGGLAVLHLSGAFHNNCSIKQCNFVGNVAYYGGGMSMGTKKNGEHNSSFLVEESTFENNNAKIGSAMDLFCYSILDYQHCHCIVTPEIRKVSFVRNGGLYMYVTRQERTFATIHLEDQRVKFSGDVWIKENQASGVGLENSIMEVMQNANVLLQNNTAGMGGGLLVSGNSEIHLHEDTKLSMIDNMATERGGGILIKQTERFFSVYSYTCFVRYRGDRANSKMHPNDWKVNITFRGNSANGRPNALFATSIYPCVWPLNETNSQLRNEILGTFCNWSTWHFESNYSCNSLIRTHPQNFSQNEYSVEVYPRLQTLIENFATFDDFEHNVTNNTIFAASVISPNKTMENIREPALTGSGIQVGGRGKETFQVLVQTAYHRSVSTTVNVTIKECPLGYQATQKGVIVLCECSISHIPWVRCNENDLSISIFIGHCVGYGRIGSNESKFVGSKCPFTATNPFSPEVSMSEVAEDFNEAFCGQYNRTGLLCQDCKSEYGIDIFSPTYKCINCTDSYVNWIIAISAVIGPQTLFFLVVIVLHIGITAPSMTAFVFFSHVITIPLEIIVVKSAWNLDLRNNKNSQILTDILMSPYRVWIFDYPEIFHVKTCLYPSLKIMHAIAFRYLHALYPIAMLAAALILIELHARNCKPIVYLWKPMCFLCIRLRRKWDIKTSVIDAFATVILLSYSKIINTSLYLLTQNYIRNASFDHIQTRLDYDTSVIYFQQQHIIFASLAIFILCTFGTIPPLLLLVYPSRLFFKLLTKIKLDQWHGLHMFVETFQGSFKNRTNGSPERRWFAGLYFIFRIIVFAIFAFTEDLIRVHYNLAIAYTVFMFLIFFLKPYKNDLYTYLDASFMGILVIANFTTVYSITQVQLPPSKIPRVMWRTTYALLLIPTTYLITYSTYLLFTRSRSAFIQNYCISGMRRFRQRTVMYFANTEHTYERISDNDHNNYYSITSVDGPTHSSLDNFSDVPDRVDNPQRYCNMEWSHQRDGSGSIVSGQAKR